MNSGAALNSRTRGRPDSSSCSVPGSLNPSWSDSMNCRACVWNASHSHARLGYRECCIQRSRSSSVNDAECCLQMSWGNLAPTLPPSRRDGRSGTWSKPDTRGPRPTAEAAPSSRWRSIVRRASRERPLARRHIPTRCSRLAAGEGFTCGVDVLLPSGRVHKIMRTLSVLVT